MKKERTEFDVKVTKTLIDAYKAGKLDDGLERRAVENFRSSVKYGWSQAEAANLELPHVCGILYSGHERMPVSNAGWIEPIRTLSYRLESLNYEYSRYGFRVVMDQTKEKFGRFRGYWHIEHSLIGIDGIVAAGLDRISGFLGRFSRLEKIRTRISELLGKIVEKTEADPEYVVRRGMLEYEAARAVSDCENECSGRCCDCGARIGKGFEPVCESQGWVLYRCRRCSMASGGVYYDTVAKKYMVEGKAVKKPGTGCVSSEKHGN